MYRLVVLLSGSGSNLQALIDAIHAGDLAAEVALVVSDRPDAYGLQRALNQHIAAAFIPLLPANVMGRQAARATWEQRLLALIRAYEPQLIVSAGFMRVLSARFLEQCAAPVINQHPALLPVTGGDTVITTRGTPIPALRGAHVVAEALRLGLNITGCSIHRVTALVDDGPVLAQAEVPILPDDTEASLHERIKIEERRLIVEVVQQLSQKTPA